MSNIDDKWDGKLTHSTPERARNPEKRRVPTQWHARKLPRLTEFNNSAANIDPHIDSGRGKKVKAFDTDPKNTPGFCPGRNHY